MPVPEVFGWADDDGERFHYMSLVNGETLLVRWSSMNDNERRAVCNELKHMAKQWRALSQDGPDPYIGNKLFQKRHADTADLIIYFIGSLGRQPLSDIFLGYLPEYAGPFQGANVVQQFHEVCGLKSTMTCPLYSRMLILSHPTFFYAGPGSEGGSGY